MQDAVNPVLLAQAQDDYYLKSGLEYVAYDNLRRARENLENAQNALEDVANDEQRVYEEFYDAEWEF